MQVPNSELNPQPDPIEEARKNFEYAKQMAHLANTKESLDYWNAEIDRTEALLDKAIQEDEEKHGGLKIRVFEGYETTLDFGTDKKAKQESGIDPVSSDDSDAQVIPYATTVRLPEPKPVWRQSLFRTNDNQNSLFFIKFFSIFFGCLSLQ